MIRALYLWWLRVRLDVVEDQMRICIDRRDDALGAGDVLAAVVLAEIFDSQCARRDRIEARIASLSTTC